MTDQVTVHPCCVRIPHYIAGISYSSLKLADLVLKKEELLYWPLFLIDNFCQLSVTRRMNQEVHKLVD